jgi:acyl-CoA dehydrogenase
MALTHFFGRPQNILMACKGEQVERYLKPAVRGERMDALAMTEPEAGSDIRSMRTTARRAGGDWLLNGTKHFISGAEHADFVIVFAATGADADKPRQEGDHRLPRRPRHAGLHHPRGLPLGQPPGLSELGAGVRRLPAARRPGARPVHGGFAVMNEWLYATRITVAAMCVGRARRVFDLALDQAATRRQFGQPIGRFQGVGFQLADMATEIDAADWLTLAAAWRLDAGLPANREIARPSSMPPRCWPVSPTPRCRSTAAWG